MRYFIISKAEEGGFALETFEAKNTKEALLHVVDSWNGFTKDEDYQKCKNMSLEEIGEYLANMNVDDEIMDLALFRADDVSEFGEGDPRGPVWSIFDHIDASSVF